MFKQLHVQHRCMMECYLVGVGIMIVSLALHNFFVSVFCLLTPATKLYYDVWVEDINDPYQRYIDTLLMYLQLWLQR